MFPFEKVVGVGEVSGWFEVLNAGSNAVSTCRSDDEMSQKASQERDLPTGPPRIFASLKWLAPPSEDGQRAAESERVASQALQEELVRFATLTKSRKTDLLGSSIGAVNTALGRLYWQVVCMLLAVCLSVTNEIFAWAHFFSIIAHIYG